MSWKLLATGLLAVPLAMIHQGSVVSAQTPLKAQASVYLTFDEEAGSALDSATIGATPDNGTLANDVPRITSPFWNQSGKRAIELNPTRQQYVELADSADVDRPDAASVSVLAINLLEPSDAAYHGLFAKRGVQDGKIFTNYGINFTMQADNFQVYIGDGRGYRVVQYSSTAALPVRKLMHLTATFLVGDAPGADADSDADDVRIQLFANGEPLTPKAVTGGFVNGTEGWITDVEIAGLVNNLPVTLGRSEAGGEYFHGILDEFMLFPKALSPEEARQLFMEIAGANVQELIQLDQPAPPRLPEIARLSQSGLTVGQTTQIVIVGKNFLPEPKVALPLAGVVTEFAEPPKDDRLVVKFIIPPDTVAGFYPLCLQTAAGISAMEPVAMDALPHVSAAATTPEKPLTLPTAVVGFLAGGQEPRAYFQGKAGQRVVADLEMKRLGGKANPVLELKTAAGTPITIAWGEAQLEGDVRLEHTLPADGLYMLELHDLVYRAPGPNPYRLKLGDLKLVDITLPVVATAGAWKYRPIGPGLASEALWTTSLTEQARSLEVPVVLPENSGVAGPWPHVKLSHGIEVIEPEMSSSEELVNATFVDSSPTTVGINGRLAKPGEKDAYLLSVTPGQTLRLKFESQSLRSPIAGEIEVLAHPQGHRLAISGDQPSETDPMIDLPIPAGQTQVKIVLRDLYGHGSPRSVYRLLIAPAGRPDFSLVTTASNVQIPENGTAIIEVNVTRSGYQGPIALSVDGLQDVSVTPVEIAAGVAGKVLCRLQRTAGHSAVWPAFRLIGTAQDGNNPMVRLTQRAETGGLAPYRDTLLLGTTQTGGMELELVDVPKVVFRGTSLPLKIKLVKQPDAEVARQPVRVVSRSTELKRNTQPNNPAAGQLPVVEVPSSPLIAAEAAEATVNLKCPLDVAEPTIEFVLVAEAVSHPYSDRVVARAYSIPFRATVQMGVAPKLEPASFGVKGGAEHFVTGQLQRTAGFTAPVTVALAGLPAGYMAEPAQVAGDQNEFRIKVMAPAVTAETPVPNIKLQVTSGGGAIAADQDVALKVLPPQ